MTLLIDRAFIQQHKQLSNTVHSDKLNQMILEAQMHDLTLLIGEGFYNEIISSPASFGSVLNEGNYTHQTKTFKNYGLKSVLVHYTYARYVMFGDLIDNPFSITAKLNVNESKPIDYRFKKTIYHENRQMAYNIWLNVERYLIRTNNPHYTKHCNTSRANKHFKLYKIG